MAQTNSGRSKHALYVVDSSKNVFDADDDVNMYNGLDSAQTSTIVTAVSDAKKFTSIIAWAKKFFPEPKPTP